MTFKVSLNTKQLDSLVVKLGDMQKELPRVLEIAVKDTVNQSLKPLLNRTPKITGNLRRGFLPRIGIKNAEPGADRTKRLGLAKWLITNPIKYFMFIETGKGKTKSGKTKTRKAGAAKMLEKTVPLMQKLLNKNIGLAVVKVLKRTK